LHRDRSRVTRAPSTSRNRGAACTRPQSCRSPSRSMPLGGSARPSNCAASRHRVGRCHTRQAPTGPAKSGAVTFGRR
jgi:hypothetical protein